MHPPMLTESQVKLRRPQNISGNVDCYGRAQLGVGLSSFGVTDLESILKTGFISDRLSTYDQSVGVMVSLSLTVKQLSSKQLKLMGACPKKKIGNVSMLVIDCKETDMYAFVMSTHNIVLCC